MSQATTTVTDSSFQREVLASAKPVLVDYWAEWCGPCRMIGPLVEESATQYADRSLGGQAQRGRESGYPEQLPRAGHPDAHAVQGWAPDRHSRREPEQEAAAGVHRDQHLTL